MDQTLSYQGNDRLEGRKGEGRYRCQCAWTSYFGCFVLFLGHESIGGERRGEGKGAWLTSTLRSLEGDANRLAALRSVSSLYPRGRV